ncbi:hypothetical protein [Cellulomonas bogoriensis]|uniref:hypothetical protein n=1 Tax=Cellulomonas bogoriensis TaxID=301388 RepID=UPI000A5EF81D|nr:hypothetical protein [Cellulomonas bogoriensis]
MPRTTYPPAQQIKGATEEARAKVDDFFVDGGRAVGSVIDTAGDAIGERWEAIF